MENNFNIPEYILELNSKYFKENFERFTKERTKTQSEIEDEKLDKIERKHLIL